MRLGSVSRPRSVSWQCRIKIESDACLPVSTQTTIDSSSIEPLDPQATHTTSLKMSSSSLSSPSELELRSRLSAVLAPVSLMPVGALACARGSVLDIVYNEYRDSLDRLLTQIRSYDERIHGALQVGLLADYEERWRVYQMIAIEYASAAEQSEEDTDYACELALRNSIITKKRDAIAIFVASFDRVAEYNPDGWFEELNYLIAAAQKEWDEMVEMRYVYAEDDE